eukprot:889103-Pyramimonas_sp.AAC.1
MQLLDQESRDLEFSSAWADAPSEVKASHRQRATRRQEMWRKFKCRTYLSSIYDENGIPRRPIDHSAEVFKD